MQNSKVIGDRTFVVKCEESLSLQAEWLLELIKEIEESSRIKNGMRIQAGWTIFTTIERNDCIEIVAPNYDTDPFNETSEDLTVSLSVQLRQNQLLKELNLDGEESLFQDKIIVVKGAIDLEKIYLERSQSVTKGDSGWYLGPVEESDDEIELEAIYIYQLVKLRPDLLKALAIPRGYIVVFDKDRIEAILDDDDNDIYKE